MVDKAGNVVKIKRRKPYKHNIYNFYPFSEPTPTIMTATSEFFSNLFTPETLQRLFPKDRADEFFDALFGDASEGAFDIELTFHSVQGNQLCMDLLLHERPGHCLACNLTQGLPQVFTRHPIININGLVKEIETLAGDSVRCTDWALGYTRQRSRSTHVIPLTIDLETA